MNEEIPSPLTITALLALIGLAVVLMATIYH